MLFKISQSYYLYKERILPEDFRMGNTLAVIFHPVREKGGIYRLFTQDTIKKDAASKTISYNRQGFLYIIIWSIYDCLSPKADIKQLSKKAIFKLEVRVPLGNYQSSKWTMVTLLWLPSPRRTNKKKGERQGKGRKKRMRIEFSEDPLFAFFPGKLQMVFNWFWYLLFFPLLSRKLMKIKLLRRLSCFIFHWDSFFFVIDLFFLIAAQKQLNY